MLDNTTDSIVMRGSHTDGNDGAGVDRAELESSSTDAETDEEGEGEEGECISAFFARGNEPELIPAAPSINV